MSRVSGALPHGEDRSRSCAPWGTIEEALEDSAIRHVLVRHEEGGTHAAEGYTRARAGRIGVCIGTSGPAGTNMVTGLYSASADSVPILCITGQAPRAKLHKEDFQAVDVAAV